MGIIQGGNVITGAIGRGQVVKTPGVEYYVDGTNGGDTADGESWDTALATIQAAINKCVSGQHDIIYVRDGTYAEALSVSSKDYVSIIGISLNGYGRPDIGPASGTTPALTVNRSQGFVARNLRFYSADINIDVVVNEGNGFVFDSCVFDGSTAMGATKSLLKLKGDATSASFTASEGIIRDCLFRLSPGYGLAIDEAPIGGAGVGSTYSIVERCRFVDNTAEDVIALASEAGGVYSIQDFVFHECWFMSKNKATHVDISTNNAAGNTGNVFSGCFFFDDTINTTAIKAGGTGSGFIGCYSLDGVIDGDLLD